MREDRLGCGDTSARRQVQVHDDDVGFELSREPDGVLSLLPGQAEVVAAIRSVKSGGSAFGPGVSQRIVDAFLQTARTSRPFPELSEREHDVLALVADGHRNPVIAQRLHLSPKTVRNLVSSVMTKLQAQDRTALALLARERRLGTSD